MAAKTTGISLDLLIHPGETLADVLAERGISQSALAVCTGVTPAFVSNVISGKKDISANFAMALEYALGVPKTFWINLQANYDAELLEATQAESITESEFDAYRRLSEVAVRCEKNGVFAQDNSTEARIISLRRTLRISNVANLDKAIPRGAFRLAQNRKLDPLVLGAWVRLCQIANEEVPVDGPFDPKNLPQLIGDLKTLMLQCPLNELQASLQEALAGFGIAFSIVRHFEKAPVHGYVAKRDDGTYTMAVTIQDHWEDVFWFSLFHEIGHIANSDVSPRQRELVDLGIDQAQENRADAFARNALIDPSAYSSFLAAGKFTYSEIERLADEQRVKPCIVVGRLHREGILPTERFANRRPRIKWVDES
ncbi:MAG: HigA family addiction module antitoxin [Coriobacteriia bacterium]|nr:HigA family addiction module antitoxin [Coriobacteriia bacterium]